MKKGKLAIIAALLVSGSVIGGITANAAQVGAGKTDTTIGFKQDTIIPPTDGELSLVSTPTSIDFGQANETNDIETFYKTENNQPYYLIVRDDRRGTAAEEAPGKWTLTANASSVEEAIGTERIENAKYTFGPTGGTYTNTNTTLDPNGNGTTEMIADWQNPAIPTASTVNSVLPTGTVVDINAKPIILTNGDTTTLATSTAGGTAEQKEAFALQMNNFSLVVPGKNIGSGKRAAKEGTVYNGEINWVLDNTAL